MWANNEVGTVNPVRELAAVAHEYGVPLHTDAVQAVGILPVDFAASGADALTAHRAQARRPVRRRRAAAAAARWRCTALLHGGGQERDVRSGTLDTPAIVALAAAVEIAVADAPRRAAMLAGLRDDLVGKVLATVPDARLNGDPGTGTVDGGPSRLPGNAHLSFPGCEGDSLLMLLDAHGIECSTGSACTAGVAQPSHVLLAMGADEATRPRLAALLARAHLHRGRRRGRRRGDRPGGRAGAAGRAAARRPAGELSVRASMRVLAAMSGGVDSAVAAARAVDAGHDVVGVHLALSQTPAALRTGVARAAARGRTPRDARRAADVLGIPFYVWDFAARFSADVVDDFVAAYARGQTPNPCLRCNEKIKFSALLDRALALGFDAVVHRALRAAGTQGVLRRAVDADKDQSYVLAVLTRRAAAARDVPAGRHAQGRGAGRGRRRAGCGWPTSPTATTSASSPPATPAASSPRGSARARARSSTPGRARCWRRHDGVHGFTVGQRRGLGLGRPGRGRAAALRPGHRAGERHRAGRARRGAGRAVDRGARRRVERGRAPDGPVTCVGAGAGARRPRARDRARRRAATCASSWASRCAGVAPGQAVALYRPDPDGRRRAGQRHDHRRPR